jgi:predicted kinase
MTQNLTIIRGLPGSGKSTLAQALVFERGAEGEYGEVADLIHVEADMYFINAKGEYEYDGSKIKDAHTWCQNTVRINLLEGHDVIVSNTFTQLHEMELYFAMARAFNAKLQVIECHGNFGSIHHVPAEVMTRMADRWEPLPRHYYAEQIGNS